MTLPVSALKSMRVMIATPCYGTCQLNFVGALFSLAGKAAVAGLSLRFDSMSSSLITHARNGMVARFLSDPSFTHLFFIDADMGFQPQDFFRLLLADRDVIAATCPRKEVKWPAEGFPAGLTKARFEAHCYTYPVNALPPGHLAMDSDGFAEVESVGTGFMCIKRGVFDRLQVAYPDLDFVEPNDPPGAPGTHWLFFETLRIPEKKYALSEDLAFCHRWRAIGGKVYLDVTAKISHQGAYVWHGDLMAHLNAKHSPP